MDEALTCTSCGATVLTDEVEQGLAIRVSGHLMCPLCVDHLPGDAKVLINQMRALRGLAVTTYRYASARHPGLPLFTFTTTALVTGHRRRLRLGETFTAPALPPPGSRMRLPTAAEAGRGERHGWIVVAATALVVIGGLIWLLVGSGSTRTRPETPPPQTPAQTAQPVVPPARPAQSTTEDEMLAQARQLAELENRFRSNPKEAADIHATAEQLREALPANAVALCNRADELIRSTAARIPAPATAPEPIARPAPATAPEHIARPVPATTPEPIAKPVPATAPEPEPKVGKVPAVHEPKVTAAKPKAPVVWIPRISWPTDLRPLIAVDGPLPDAKVSIPWPWPSSAALWEAVFDRKASRVALELTFTLVGENGGVALTVHPRRAERTALIATWSDGTTTSPPLRVLLDGLRWQTVAIPAPGHGFDFGQLRLRLEDGSEHPVAERPFLIGPATMLADRAPRLDDCDPGLPLMDPAPLSESRFLDALRTIAKDALSRRFDASAAKVLLPDVGESKQQEFSGDLRNRLLDFARVARRNGSVRIPNGNPADLPLTSEDLLDLATGWPSRGALADFDQYSVVVVGLRQTEWGQPEKLEERCTLMLNKLLNKSARPPRVALLPLLAIGDVEKAGPEEIAAVEATWLPLARKLVSQGVPVIDLRPAMREERAPNAHQRAARIIVEALRQLDWALKR